VPPAALSLREIVAARSLRIGVGTAIGGYFNRADTAGRYYSFVVAREFDVVTPENELKFTSVRPTRATFRFARPDSMLAFATANGMRMRGHTLVWGNQLSAWLTGGSWTRAEGIALLDEHITTTVAHYKGKLAAWDVVNEALNDNGTLRPTFWLQLIGPAYIEQAFRTAAAADPSARLFYNDYRIETNGPKSDAALAMLTDLKARGVPVHGIGMQGHFVVGQTPSRDALVANMARFAALGLKIQITELDIRMPVPATTAALQTQAADYAAVFRACLDVPACDMVVTWGFTDLSSWIPTTFPGMGAALLFDATFQPKPAYTAVHELLERS
jgi:endo-1,4-beta-xylanase